MDSLVNRIRRLSPDQQRSVEDYVDFLLSRSGDTGAGRADLSPAVSVPVAAPPPLITVPELPVSDPADVRIAPGTPCSLSPPASNGPDPATLLMQEIASEKEDILTAGYMDYGTFEQEDRSRSPSPADAAVRRVKAKLMEKKADDPVQDVLDWID